MKAEDEPIAADEWLLRLVWKDRFVDREPPVSPNAFEPRGGNHPDTDGLSLFRESCVEKPEDILSVVDESKRDRYGIVRVPVSLLASLGLSAHSAAIGEVPGHVVVPELNIVAYTADKASFTGVKATLAEVAAENIVRRPLGS